MSRQFRRKSLHPNHHSTHRSRRGVCPLLLATSIAAALVASVPAAQAATNRWKTGAPTQNWFNANNWTGGVAPDTTMDVIIDNTDPGGKGALLGNNSATVRSLAIGAPNTGLLTVNGGADLTVRKDFILGNTPDSAGTLNTSGTGTAIDIGTTFEVGNQGDGILNITNGATVTDDSASLANFNGYIFKKSTGTYIKVSDAATAAVVVSGANSLWANNNGATIGNGGSAVVTLTDGGTLSAGDGAGGKGTVKAGWAAVSQARGQINIGAAKGAAAAAPGVLDAAALAFGNYGVDATGAQKGGGALLFNHTSSNYVFSPQITGHAHIDFLAGTTRLTATGSSVVNASVDQGATMILDGGSLDLDVAGEVQGGNTVALTVGDAGAGTLTLTNGAELVLGGSHSMQVAVTASASGTINIGAPLGSAAAAPGTLAFSSDAAQPWIQFRNGTGTLVFNHTSDAYSFDAPLQGNGSLIQSAGTTILTANNSQHRGGGTSATGFTGPVTINGGTLLVNNIAGSGTGTGDVTVNANGTLGGTGEIAGNVTGVGAGSLQGVQGQTLTIDGSLNLNNDSNIDVSLSTPDKSAGMFDVKGNLVLDGNINVTDGGGMGPGVYRMFDYGGTLTDNTAVIGTVPSGVSKTAFQVQTSVANQVNLISSAGQQLFYWDGDTAGNANNGAVDGGSGDWFGSGTTWTGANGTANVMMSTPGFAIFETTGGTVTVADPTASVTGMQFAADGYDISGAAVALTTDQTNGNIIRVGDGTAAGAGMTATIDSVLTGGTGLHKTDRGTLILTGNNTYDGGTTIEGGVLQVAGDENLGADGSAVTLDGGTLRLGSGFSDARPIVLTDAAGGGGIDTHDGSDNAILDGQISGPGTLVKLGAGTLILTGLNGASSYGGTIVKAGNLIGNAGAISGDVGVSSGATVTFDQDTNATFAGHFTGKGTAVLNGTGNLTLSGQSDGTLNWNVFAGNLITRSDLFHSNADIDSGAQLVFKQDGSSNYGGTLTGDGQFTKQGAGVVQLTGDNSAFAGSTLVSGGGITVNDTLGGSVSVSNGGSLGGTGEILGKVGIADGGILLGDQQAGPLTMHGLVLNNGSLVDVSLSGPGNTTGLFNVQGDLTLDGTLNITDEGSGFGAGVYRVMDYSGTLTDNGMDIGTVPGGFSAAGMAVQTSVANEVNLVTTSGDVQFWDGDATGNVGNGQVDGGDGTWTATSSNWTDVDGGINGTMDPTPGFAIFEAAPGTVTVDDSQGNVTVTGMQFASDYTVQGAAITLVPDAAGDDIALRVGDGTTEGAGDTATIASDLANTSGHVTKTDLGTLVLTGNSTLSNVSLHDGTTRLASGGTLQADMFSVADVAGDDAVLDVTGTGSTLNISTVGIDSLFIGYHGTGKLVIENGGAVRNLGGSGFRTSSYIGSNTDGQGTVVVTGAGSLWDAGSLAVGAGNHGSLLIKDGGTVSHGGNNPLINVGVGKGSVGQVTVTGKGSTWNIPTGTTIGNQGTGALTIADGGTVGATSSGSDLDIAYATGSTGTVNIGAAVGDKAAAAGTLNVASVTFGDGTGMLVFNHTGDDTFAPALSGTGSVQQLAGTTIMNADSSAFDGTVSVQGGTLIVGDDGHAGAALGGPVDVASGATLGGFGTIGSLDLSGTLSPGDSIGTLHVTGDAVFEKGSTFDVEITPAGKADTLNVGGKTTINGGTVDAIKAAGHYTGDTRYTLVDADKGVSGTFDTLTQNMPFLNLALGYDPDHVYLTVQRNDVSFCDVAGTVNECDTGQGVESTGVVNPVYDTIAGLPNAATARAAFDQLSGEFHASQESARIDDSRFVREAMDQRLREGANDAEADRVPGTKLTTWAHAWGHWGTINGDGNAAKLSDNGDGLLVGADVPVGKTGRVGVTGGASRNSLSVRYRDSWARTTSQWLGVFGGFTQGPFAFRAGAAYAWDKIPAYREVHLPGFSEQLSSSVAGSTVTGYVEGAWQFQLAHATIAPYLNLANVHVDTDAATETGGTAALHMDSENMETSLGTLGVRGNWHVAHHVSLHADLGWQHAFGDITPARTQQFANGDAFTVYGVPLAQNAGLARLGVNWRITPRTTFTAGYEGLWGDGVQDTAAKASLQVKF